MPVTTETHCPYCSLQCGMRLAGRRTPEVQAWEEFPVNRGALCRKGWAAAGLYGGRERLRRRVELLHPEHLDPDMLDERARETLGLMHPDEVVVFQR